APTTSLFSPLSSVPGPAKGCATVTSNARVADLPPAVAVTVMVAEPVVVADGVMVRVKGVPAPLAVNPALGTTFWSELVALTLIAADAAPVTLTDTVRGSPRTVDLSAMIPISSAGPLVVH